jgi:hypothetical protein
MIEKRRLPRVHSERMILIERCPIRAKQNPYGGTANPLMTSRDDYRVDCRICMYHLGLYMPLVKLEEHQNHNKTMHSFQKEFFKPQPLVGL